MLISGFWIYYIKAQNYGSFLLKTSHSHLNHAILMFPGAHINSVTPKSEKSSNSMANCISSDYEVKPLYIWTKYSYKKTHFLPLYSTAEALKIAIFCLNRGFSRSQKDQKLLILTLIYLIGKWSAQKHCLNRGFCFFWRCLNQGSTVLNVF